jgi:hypothetical protein
MGQKNISTKLNLEDEFKKIHDNLTRNLEVLCVDLHSIRIAILNLPDQKHVKVPNPYISYFLNEDIETFVAHTKHNSKNLMGRSCNNFAISCISAFEDSLKYGYSLMTAILKQTTMSVKSSSFKLPYESELEKIMPLGSLIDAIKGKVKDPDNKIVPIGCSVYGYCDNYILLRNCLLHKRGKISKFEKNMEIRLPVILEEQLKAFVTDSLPDQIFPQTVIRKWGFGETIQLSLEEVEGISYGLMKTSFELIKHMYKFADNHLAGLENAGRL